MILSDAHQFAFLHIPKTGGMSVRRALAPYDTTNETFFYQETLPGLGAVDMAHLTLATLRDHFPAEFEKVRRYWAFAVVRDPNERFASSLYYWLHQVRWKSRAVIAAMPARSVIEEAHGAIELIEQRSGQYPAEIAHFAPQADFVQVEGTMLVDAILPLSVLSIVLPRLMAERFGLDLEIGRENDAMRKQPGRRAELAHRLARVTPRGPLRQRASAFAERFQQPGNPLAPILMERRDIRAFIQAHYHADFELHERALSTWQSQYRQS